MNICKKDPSTWHIYKKTSIHEVPNSQLTIQELNVLKIYQAGQKRPETTDALFGEVWRFKT